MALRERVLLLERARRAEHMRQEPDELPSVAGDDARRDGAPALRLERAIGARCVHIQLQRDFLRREHTIARLTARLIAELR